MVKNQKFLVVMLFTNLIREDLDANTWKVFGREKKSRVFFKG